MRNPVSSGFLELSALLLVMGCVCHAQSDMAHAPAASPSVAKPLLLEKNEGELRTRRPRPKPSPASQFMLKAGPKINGSQHLVVGTEQIAPGASIPTHKHPTEDEIVLIHSGTAHAWVGEQERDLHAGGLVFIPANTWVGLKNTSTEPLDVTFIFSAPGFDDFQMCISVPAGETPTPMTAEDLQKCQAPGHMIYKETDAKHQ
jgi:quercetin dioxygenase-like cupin family protein